MTDRPMPPIPNGVHLTPEQIEAISGGGCSLSDLETLTAGLRQSYDNLVDFTSYVIERVVTSTQ
jgi:hypothetical protein